MPRQWRIELLDKKVHLREGFSCGKESLDSYLQKTARNADKVGTGKTLVAVDLSGKPNEAGKRPILGYYTVAMSSIDLSAIPESYRGGLPQLIPAALLARLAVDKNAQGEGLGRTLLVDALRRIARASLEVPAHAVVLDAKDDDAKAFYLQYGFLELTDDPLHLFLPVESVRKTVEK